MGWQDIVIAGIAGFASGDLASISAPWANWGVEKRRLRRQSRVERISEWRKGVEELRRAGERRLHWAMYRGSPEPIGCPRTT